MTLSSAVLSFALVAGLLTLVPGLDTALVLRSAITQGRAPAFATALGINTGALVWGAGAAVGVSALLTASTIAYMVLRIAGAGYMVLLGTKLIRSAWNDRETDDAAPGFPGPTGNLRQAWQRGLLTNLLNPKIGAFYLAVLPQFIPPGSAHLAVGLLLALVHDAEGIAWFTVLIVAAGNARQWLDRRRVRRVMDGATGAVLIAFGVELSL